MIAAALPWLIAYALGFVIVQILARLILRGEPTAHGQIVGRQFAFVVGLLWPIALPLLALPLIAASIRALINRGQSE